MDLEAVGWAEGLADSGAALAVVEGLAEVELGVVATVQAAG